MGGSTPFRLSRRTTTAPPIILVKAPPWKAGDKAPTYGTGTTLTYRAATHTAPPTTRTEQMALDYVFVIQGMNIVLVVGGKVVHLCTLPSICMTYYEVVA